MQRIVGGIEIEDDLFGGRLVRLQEQRHKQSFNRRRIMRDLVIPRHPIPAQLKPVERRFASHRRALRSHRFELTRQHRHQRIVTQFVVVVQILLAKRDPEHPLTDQRYDLMLDQVSPPLVVKARRKPIDHPDRSIRRSQKQRPGVRRHKAGIKSCFHSATFNGSKIKLFCATPSASGLSSNQLKVAAAQRLSLIRSLDAPN